MEYGVILILALSYTAGGAIIDYILIGLGIHYDAVATLLDRHPRAVFLIFLLSGPVGWSLLWVSRPRDGERWFT